MQSGLDPWVSALSGDSSESQSVRDQMEHLDGEQITTFHDSDLFEVEDCAPIPTPVGDDKNPPIMKRLREGCGAH